MNAITMPITVVSGLPRSGTSMMMSMLEAGGLEPYTDGLRKSDVDNPKGYYEVERVKSLKTQQDKSWLAAAEGKVIKVVSSILKDLPPAYHYQVVFSNRKLEEVLASQNKMRIRRGDRAESDDAALMRVYEQHLRSIKAWMAAQSNFRFLEVDYADAIQQPAVQADRILEFVGVPFDLGSPTRAVIHYLQRRDRSAVAPGAHRQLLGPAAEGIFPRRTVKRRFNQRVR